MKLSSYCRKIKSIRNCTSSAGNLQTTKIGETREYRPHVKSSSLRQTSFFLVLSRFGGTKNWPLLKKRLFTNYCSTVWGQSCTMEQRCKGVPYLLPMWCKLRKSRASPRGMPDKPKIFAAMWYQSYRGLVSKSYNYYFQNDCNNCCWRLGRRCRKMVVETGNNS